MYSIYLPFTSISYVQENFQLSKRNQSWIKLFFCIGGFPLTYNIIYYLILGNTNNVLYPLVKNVFVHSVGSGTSEKVLQ